MTDHFLRRIVDQIERRSSPSFQKTEDTKKVRGLKEPSEEALMAYRLHILLGSKQKEIAEQLSEKLGKTIKQPTISKWIARVKDFVSAGGVLPQLPEKMNNPKSVDPGIIAMGRRRDHRARRQRNERTEE